MRKENDTQKNIFYFHHQNFIERNSNIFYSTSQQKKLLDKPDFSPLINGENKLGLKINGSYKKPSNIVPESPVKGPIINYATPMKIKGRDLFGAKNINQLCRKLDFDDFDKIDSNNKIIDNKLSQYLNKFNINNNNSPLNNLKVCNNKMENNFSIIKTIKEMKYNAAYVVKENKTGKLFFIKKISKKSKKNNFSIIETLFNDIKNNNKNLKDNKLKEKF